MIGAFLIDWRLSILVIGLIPFRYFIVVGLAKRKKKLFSKYIDAHRDYSGWYGDNLAGIKEIKIWNLEKFKLSQFTTKQREMIKQEVKMAYIENVNNISETLFDQVISTFLYLVGGYLIVGNSLSIGKLFAFITYSSYITAPIFAIMNIGFTFAGILPSAERYFNFIGQNKERQVLVKKVDIDKIEGSIEFKNVSFYYKKDNIILKNINFKINKGEKIAVIGRNGEGKSTIVNLLLRLISPNSGQVLLDGEDIQKINLKQYRNVISVVNQDTYLFNTTIKENIIFNSKNNINDMYIAANKCGADKFIEKMKDKYESSVGDRGAKLSGGERQKIAMARALVKNAKILILDEATANYDAKAEKEMNKVIESEFKNQTVVIITHRQEVLVGVDKIIVLNKGIIEEIGNHKELIENNELYKSLFNNKSIKV